MKYKQVVGIDIGGSHITSAVVNFGGFEIIAETYVRTRINAMDGVENIISGWAAGIKQTVGDNPLSDVCLGVAIPGPFDYDKGISYMRDQGKYDALYGLDVKELLADALRISPDQIRFSNDAACFLQGEIYRGGMDQSKKTIGFTLGTGLGSAYMEDGAAYDADLWNSPYQGGIIEEYISSRWFVKVFKERTGGEIKDVKRLVTDFGTETVAQTIFRDFSRNLASFLASTVKQMGAEAIVLGGNITKASDYFLEEVKLQLKEILGLDIPIRLSVLGEDAALIGAAALFYPKKDLNPSNL